jgi:hypothetical protein
MVEEARLFALHARSPSTVVFKKMGEVGRSHGRIFSMNE